MPADAEQEQPQPQACQSCFGVATSQVFLAKPALLGEANRFRECSGAAVPVNHATSCDCQETAAAFINRSARSSGPPGQLHQIPAQRPGVVELAPLELQVDQLSQGAGLVREGHVLEICSQ